MSYYAIFTSLVILEAPTNKMSFREFKQTVKEWLDNGEIKADIFVGKTWAGREYICSMK